MASRVVDPVSAVELDTPESGRIDDDRQRRQRHGRRGDDRVQVAERGNRYADAVVDKGPEQVLV